MDTTKKYIQNLYQNFMMPPDKIPLLVSNTLLAGYFFGESGMAVVSLFMPIYFLFETIGFWINYGGIIKTLEKISENKTLEARAYSSLSLILSIILGVISSIFVYIFFDNILKILSVPESLISLSQDYGKFLIIAGFLLIICTYAWQFVKIVGLQNKVRKIYVLIMLVDIVACAVCEKFFALGIISLAVGMIFAEIFIIVFIGIQLYKNFKKNLFAEIKDPINSTLNLIYAGSSPSAGKFYTLFQVFLFNLFLLRFLGETGVAVFAVIQMAVRICRLHSQVTWQPIPLLFAMEFGDKNFASMIEIFKTSMKRAIIFAVLPAVVIFFGADFLITKSSLNPSAYDFAADALEAYSLSVVLAAINSIFITVYLSTNHKILSNLAEFMRSIVAIIFCLNFLALEDVFYTFLIAEVVASVILFFGNILIKKSGNFKTVLLLEEDFFKPSTFMVVDRNVGITAEETENIKKFLSDETLKFLNDWLNLLKKFSDTGKDDFLAIHILSDDKKNFITLHGTGKLFDYSSNSDANSLIKSCKAVEKYKFNSTLGMNNLYLQLA